MKDIKLFGKCIFSTFNHLIYEYDVDDTRSYTNRFSYIEIVDENNIYKIGGGFNPSNAFRILNKNRGLVKGLIFENAKKEVIGYCFLAYKGAHEFHYKIKCCDAFIFDFCVMPQHRGKGFSQLILDYVSNDILSDGLHTLRLAVKQENDKAITAYERYGFVCIDKRKIHRLLRMEYPTQII